MSRSTHDLIIIGAGPAGLCAGMYAGRGMLDAVVLERGVPGGELLNTDLIEDYPGFASVKGHELARLMAEHAQKFGADIRQENVETVARREDGIFEVACSTGTTFEAPTVILTAGGTPTKLGVPGELEYAGQGVSYCAVCDGAFFKGQTIAVIGGGDAAVEEAAYLTRYAEKVYVVHRREEFRASKLLQERLFANPKIEVIWNKVVTEMTGGPGGLAGLVAQGHRDRRHIDRCRSPGASSSSGSSPTPDSSPSTSPTTRRGYMITDDRMMTSIPGLFAAGDVRVQLTRQVTTAVGDATTAAIAVEKFLTERKAAAVA